MKNVTISPGALLALIVTVFVAGAGAAWKVRSFIRSEIASTLKQAELQNQLNVLVDYVQLENQKDVPLSVPLSDDERTILDALVAESKGIGFGVAVYPFESVLKDLPIDRPSAVVANLQERGFVEIGEEDGYNTMIGEFTKFPVYRVTAAGFRWKTRNASRNQ